jgi:hypothetical protein
MQRYAPRPVRFLGLIACNDWRIKVYSISVKAERVENGVLEHVRSLLPAWLTNSTLYDLPTYRIATLILHEGKEGCFAIVSWWIDINMLQTCVYLATDPEQRDFCFFSDRGMFTCVWELGVHWFERNAWVQHVLKVPDDACGLDNYLAEHFNTDL